MPRRPKTTLASFTFIDIFAGIGGLRRAFEAVGGECVLTSEWNKFAVKTYKANYADDPARHKFNSDIRELTLSNKDDVSEENAYQFIRKNVPDHAFLQLALPGEGDLVAGQGKLQEGVVKKTNTKSVTVMVGAMKWSVSPGNLTKVG